MLKVLKHVVLLLVVTLLGLSSVTAQETNTHTVQAGENLFRIALRYGVDMGALATANNITDPTRIFVGQVLNIPGLSAPDEGNVINNPLVATAPIIHTVQRGEFLGAIARQYGITVEAILQANSISNPNQIIPGQQLQIWNSSVSEVIPTSNPEVVVAEPAPAEVAVVEPAPVQSVSHTVLAGEYLSLIAQRYGVNWTTIAEANGITDPNQVFAGMTLIIPGGDPANAQSIVNNVPTVAQNLADAGAHWGVGRELVVDLSTQMAYAYEDGNLMYSALVSTGLPATPTVQGEYAIWHKTPSQTMTGPGYSLPNVQWVMYFYQGYGFHGTYWHNNFGNPMSHGCVNMTNQDALWFYNFASIGTNVWVQW